MSSREHFPIIFEQLKSILSSLAPPLNVQTDTPDNYTLVLSPSQRYPKELFFGSVRQNKNYVSFHLMPVYIFPDLLEGMSEQLKKHMQGKSCFNFTKIDEAYLDELTKLTRDGIERFRKEQSA